VQSVGGSTFANYVVMDVDEDEAAVTATSNGLPVTQSILVLTSTAARELVSALLCRNAAT
jgi:hypothetical protein